MLIIHFSSTHIFHFFSMSYFRPEFFFFSNGLEGICVITTYLTSLHKHSGWWNYLLRRGIQAPPLNNNESSYLISVLLSVDSFELRTVLLGEMKIQIAVESSFSLFRLIVIDDDFVIVLRIVKRKSGSKSVKHQRLNQIAVIEIWIKSHENCQRGSNQTDRFKLVQNPPDIFHRSLQFWLISTNRQYKLYWWKNQLPRTTDKTWAP